jgi:hypothetical protein
MGSRHVFFRACWEIIKTDITAAMHSVHNMTKGPLPKLNGALLTLRPKKETRGIGGLPLDQPDPFLCQVGLQVVGTPVGPLHQWPDNQCPKHLHQAPLHPK